MLLVSVQKFCAPEFLIAKKVVLCRVTAGEREPLHVISQSNVVIRGIIEARMGGRRRNNRRQMRREFLRGGPLIEPRVRTAPHRDLAVAKRLLRQPFDNVVSVARLIGKWFEFAAGISTAAYIDERENVTMRCEVGATGVVGV